MKHKLQTLLKHKLQWLLLLAALLGVSQGVWGVDNIRLTGDFTANGVSPDWSNTSSLTFANATGNWYYGTFNVTNGGDAKVVEYNNWIWSYGNGSSNYSLSTGDFTIYANGGCSNGGCTLCVVNTSKKYTGGSTLYLDARSYSSYISGKTIKCYLYGDDNCSDDYHIATFDFSATGTANILSLSMPSYPVNSIKIEQYSGGSYTNPIKITNVSSGNAIQVTSNTAASMTTYTPCSAPTVTANDASSVTSSSAVLSGTYSGGTSIGAKTFTITPSAGVSIGDVSCSSGTCTATATGLTVGTSYSYTFNVVNDCGTTSSPSSASFTPKNNITIKISKKSPYVTPNKIYIWYNDGSNHDISAGWPGDDLSGGDENWYIKNVDVPYGSVSFIVSNSGSNQTSDTPISSITDGETYCFDLKMANTATLIDCTTCEDLSTSDYTLTGNMTQAYDGTAKSVTIDPKPSYPSGTTYYTGINGTSYSKSSTAPTAPGQYTVTYETAATSTYCAANLEFGTLKIEKTITIKVRQSDYYSTVTPNLYAWYGADNTKALGEWPGTSMGSATNGWFSLDVTFSAPSVSLIINGSEKKQTKNITGVSANQCYYVTQSGDNNAVAHSTDCCTPPTSSGFTMSPTTVTYDGTSKSVTVSPKPGYGAVSDIKYNGSSTAPTNVGDYTVTADIAAEGDWCAVDDLEIGTFSITKRDQNALSITTSTENRCTGVLPLQLAVSGGSTSGVVTYAETAHEGTVAVSSSGEITASTNASITVIATMAGNETYNYVVSAPVTFTFTQSHVIYLKGSGASGASATYPWEYMTVEVDRSSGKTTPSDLNVQFVSTPDFSGGTAPNHSVTITDDNKYLLKSAKTVNDAHYYTVKAQDVSGGTCAASDASYNVYINSAPAEKCGE